MVSGIARFPVRRFLLFAFVSLTIAGSIHFVANAQVADLTELSEEEQRQVQIAERFVTVLERNPRRGTALDRIYGHHVEFGTLDDFMQSLRDRVSKTPDDGTGWMLLGLFEAHRGEDANAIDAFRKAEEFRADDALACYYLGQSLLLLGQPEEAVAAYERALDREPRRTDLLEIFQQLGRVHQRAQRTEAALKVWERLEEMFPDDVRVQEQIAVTLVEEGEFALALPRYENLAKLVKDDYRKTMFRIEAAELKIRASRRDEGISDFEKLMSDLNPEGWLHRDVRRRIEDVFLRSGNQDGLVTYYQKWIEIHPDDVEGMARLARYLASSARIPEATEWMEKALKLAPTRTELRKAFIDQLVDDQRHADALKQYPLLVESAPGNLDFLRDWGKLVLKNREMNQDARKAEAARVWNRMLIAQPDDALTTAQVADLFRQSKMNDEALALYEKAVKQAPNDPQYREYLGEFYHILKRSKEALVTWQAIAQGERHTAINVARLAEIYNSFGYLDDAVEQIAEACRLDEKDFALQIKSAVYHARAGKFDESLAFIDAAETLAANSEEHDAVIAERIEVYRSARRLDEEIDKLASAIKADAAAKADRWHLLARYLEADSRWADATEAVDSALKLDGKSIPALTTAARIAELSGDYGRAASMNGQLAEIDRRSRGDYLMNVARLEAQMGRSEEALKAGQDLIVSAPGNTDNYEFYAQLCFQLGKTDDGINTLRKAVRINPTEPHLIMALGAALSAEFRADEAIEVYWRAFEKTDDIDDKTSLTMKLTDLYLQVNQFDKLLDRLQREQREEEKRHAMTICLAQAHHSSGDYGTARHELESLLSEDTRDTNLLQQLSKLCQEGSDLDGAIEYQRQLADIAPGHETEYRLATLLQNRGDRDQAGEILLKLMQREESPTRRLRNVDSLLTQGGYENVIAIAEPLLSEQRDDWELLYREAVAWAKLERSDEARDRFDRLLSLSVAHDQLGVVALDKFKQAQAKARSNNLRGIQSKMPQRRSPLSILSTSRQARLAAGLDPDRSYYGSSRAAPPVWTPSVFGEARMAAYAWLIRLDQERESAATPDTTTEPGDENEETADSIDKRFEELGAAAALDDAKRDTIYDWLYVEQVRGNRDSIFQVSRRLAQQGGKQEQQFFLSSLTLRGVSANSPQTTSRSGQKPKRDPLSDDDIELMLTCHESATSEFDASMFGGQVAYGPNGQVYIMSGGSYTLVPGLMRGSASLGTIIEELKLAGREEQAEALLQKQIDSAETSQQLVGVMNMFFAEERFDRIDEFYPKWMEAARDDIAKGPSGPTTSAIQRATRATGVVDPLSPASSLLMNWMGHLGPEEEHVKILSILDGALDLSTEVAVNRRAANSRKKRRATTPTYNYAVSYSLKYGKENIRASIDYPRPNEYVDHASLMLLREVYEVFKRNEVLDDLPAHLEKRLQESTEDRKLYATLMLAYVKWWIEEKEEALALLKEAGTRLNNDPEFRLEIASLHQTMGDLDDSLDIVEAIVPRDQKLVQRREIMALQLAERLGDIDRARQSVERLFGLRLDNNTQLALVDQMRRLGMHEMAEAIVSRVQRRSGNSLSAMGSLMALYQGQGKTELAQQLAHTVLRRTTTPLTSMSSSGRNPFRYTSRNADTQMRTQAIRLLQQTGALKDLIARLESQIERSPNSPRLYGELIEYYGGANQRDKVGELLVKAVENRPDAVVLRYQLAKHLESTGKHADACDQYLAVLELKPQWIGDDLYQIRRTFDRAKRSLDLIKAFDKINLKMFSSPYYVVDLVTNMLRGSSSREQLDEENLDLALSMFERVFDAFPTYRNQLISRLRDQKLWKNDRVFELGKKGIIPAANAVAANPWFGLDSIYSYSSGGQVNAQFHQILTGIAGTEKMAELKKIIEQQLDETPDWHGGEAMLALIELKQNKKNAARDRLELLVADEEVLKSMPSHSCWIIGQELDQFEQTRPLALKLFEVALKNPGSMSQIQYSPVARLVKLYGTLGRKDDARNLLVKQAGQKNLQGYDARYSSYLHIENTVWAANELLKLDSPVDAVRMFRSMSADTAALEAAGQWYGGRPQHFASQVDQGLKKSLAALNSANADEAMDQLLAVPEKLSAGKEVLDLMLIVPSITTIREKSMESPLVDLLMTISKEKSIAVGIQKRLAELRAKYPTDLSIAVTELAYLVRKNDKQADAALKTLVAVVADSPLDEVREGRRPNSRQRKQALTQVPLWLIARECLVSESRKTEGIALAERALEAARRQSETQHAAAILYNWGKVALDRGDREQAEAKWSELLDIVTKRPERKKAPSNPRSRAMLQPAIGKQRAKVSLASFQPPTRPTARPRPSSTKPPTAKSDAARVPPLTISQFRLTMEIAEAAAENGMADLSRRAVKASMLGGTPVADPVSTPNARPGVMVAPTRSSSGTNANSGLSKIETEVAESIRKVVGKWSGDDYSALEVYDLLVPIVFPENRPAEIMMYADSSKLPQAVVNSLGAVLVQWAKKSERTDDLAARIQERLKHPQSKIPGLVMRVRVAMIVNEIDAAKASLTELSEVVGKGALPTMVQLACHAALPASSRKPLEEPAYAILKLAVNQQIQTASGSTSSSSSTSLSLGGLVSKVNRYLADEPEEVEKFFESYLAGRQAHYSRYSGTYGQYLQWKDWAAIAEEAGKVGLPTVALNYVGRVADFSYERYSRPSTKTALAVVFREMSARTPEERFEAWRDWTMPTEGRQTCRLTGEWVEPVRVPQNILAASSVQGEIYDGNLLDNFTALLDSAEECDRLTEIRDQAKVAFDAKLENADFLYALTLVRLGDVEAGRKVITPIIASVRDRLKRVSGSPTPDVYGDYLVYRACMHSSKFASIYRPKRGSLSRAMKSLANREAISHIVNEFAVSEGPQTKPKIKPGDDPELAHWFPASTKEVTSYGGDPWWVVQDGHVAHLAGSGSDLLYFAYPVTGNFEFTVDGWKGSWSETDAGYGGIVVDSQQSSSRLSVASTGGHETVTHPSALRRANERFGKITVKVADDRMQYILNGHVVYEETLSGTSPWVTLATGFSRATTFRNLRFTGDPVIPREVRLANGDRMDGWNTSFFSETQPRHRLMAKKVENQNSSDAYQQREEPVNFDWHASDGQLVARSVKGAQAKSSQSWAYYHRPLRDQESFSYEFFYVPGESVAHPTIGRVSLLLDPEGVNEHWIARTDWDEAVLGLSDDNRITNLEARRGDAPLPLKLSDWNHVELKLAGKAVLVTLNGQLVYERIIGKTLDRRFGLFKGKKESLKVRQARLTGPWPEAFSEEIRNDLLASTKKYTVPDRRLISIILGETFFKHDTAQVVAAARELPTEEAYSKLLTWVLPSPTHQNRRLYFSPSPVDSGQEQQQIVCPAYELIVAADRAGKLAELKDKVDTGAANGETALRGKIALQSLIAMHSEDYENALTLMGQLHQKVTKGFSRFMNPGDRAIEYVVAWQAMQHPELQFAGYDLAHGLLDKQRDDKFKTNDGNWPKLLDLLVGHVDGVMLRQTLAGSSDSALTQWANVPYYKPELKAKGLRHTDWLFQRGVVQHLPGGTWGQLFFQSPLRGKFEIVADRSMGGWREVPIAYGMHAADPRYDFKATRVFTVMHKTREVNGELKIPRSAGWLGEFRIAVDGGKVTTSVNGVQIHEENLTPQPDPWLLLQTTEPGSAGTVRNLRIIGSPEIPDEIDLVEIAGLSSWRADFYGEKFSLNVDDEQAPWKKVGDELHGQLRKNTSARNVQSLLMYQRPMLEDGVIEFESFYVPGEFEVHPAVGRTALMVGTSGVQKHLLTDAEYEDSGLLPGNVSAIEDAAKSVALKENNWNHFKVSLKGDQLTLAINGAEVATVTVTAPSNMRYFGLFRYSDRTKCRVRNIVYRGEWPKTLPSIAEQQLASAPSTAAPAPSQAFTLSKPKAELKTQGLQPGGPDDRLTTDEKGMRLLLQKSEGYESWPRFTFQKPIEGDFVATLDFADLRMEPAKEGWGSTFAIRANIENQSELWVECGIGSSKSGTQLKSARRHKTVSGTDRHDGRYQPLDVDSGRLRIVRSGSVISTYYARAGSEDFQLMEFHPVGDGATKSLTVQCAASDSEAVIDVVLSRLTIQTTPTVETAARENSQ